MANWFRDLWSFVYAVLAHWQALATGGLVTAIVGVYERKKKTDISWQSYAFIIFLFCIYSFFAAWQDEHRNTQTVVSEKAIAESAKNICIADYRVQTPIWKVFRE